MLQINLILRLLTDPLHVRVVVFFVLIVNFINVGEDLIVVAIEHLLNDDIDDWQRDSEIDGVLGSVDVHVHCVCMFDLAVKVRFFVVDKELIILLPCLNILFQM